jgi:hypothetical protein
LVKAAQIPKLLSSHPCNGLSGNWHPFVASLCAATVCDLTPFQGIQARFVAANPDFPNELLVALNLKDRRTHDVYRIDLKAGAVALATANPGNVIDWTADRQLKVRAATATAPDGGFDLLVREATDQPWKTMRHWGQRTRAALPASRLTATQSTSSAATTPI